MIPEDNLVNMAIFDEPSPEGPGGPEEGMMDVTALDMGAEPGMDEALGGGPGAAERYPMGLRISLSQDELFKLGLEPGALHPEDEVTIQARARVKSVIEASPDDEFTPSGMLDLQITDMSVDADMGFDDAWDEAVGAEPILEPGLEDEVMI